jgi:hypothetical protein
MSKAMECGAGDAGFACGDGEGTAERPRPIEPSPALLGKSQRGFLWVFQNSRKPSMDWVWERHDPLLIALADDAQMTIDAVDGPNLERGSFNGTQAAGVDDGATAL